MICTSCRNRWPTSSDPGQEAAQITPDRQKINIFSIISAYPKDLNICSVNQTWISTVVSAFDYFLLNSFIPQWCAV